MYFVTYLTANGKYEMPFPTRKMAKEFAATLVDINKVKGHLASGIRIVEEVK